MKTLLTVFLTIISLFSFGQLIIYNTPDTSDRFTVDTNKVSGDSTFVTVRHFQKSKLIHQEAQLNLKVDIPHTSCNTNGPNLKAYIIFSHGHSIQWYNNGQKMREGTFKLNTKLNDWKYWNKNGQEIKPPDKGKDWKSQDGFGSYFINGEKVSKRKFRKMERKFRKNNCL
jgi:hypothetical protein